MYEDRTVQKALMEFDLFIITNYVKSFMTYQGIVDTFNFISVATLVQGLSLAIFIMGVIYIASLVYIWLKEFKGISY